MVFEKIITSLAGISNQDNMLLDRRFWITVFTVTAIVPLSFMRKLDSLKYTSIVSLFAVAYLCAIVIWHFSSSNFMNDPAGNVEMIHFSTRFFRSLPVFVFAFTCHQNVSIVQVISLTILSIDISCISCLQSIMS